MPDKCRESEMVVVCRDDSGAPTVWCDPEIADLVRALNDGGIRTIASCGGHGEKPGIIALMDGRELIILPDFESARVAEAKLSSPLSAPSSRRIDMAHDKNIVLTDEQNSIIADRFPDDPANAVRAQSAVVEILSKLRAAGEPVAWVAADTLNSPHPRCVSSLAYMSQIDQDRGREYVPLYAAPVAAQKADDALDDMQEFIDATDALLESMERKHWTSGFKKEMTTGQRCAVAARWRDARAAIAQQRKGE